MTSARDPWLRRLERDTLAVGAAMALAAAVLWPRQPQRGLGVLGGLLLMAVSYRGILAGVSGLRAPPADAETPSDGPESGPRTPSRGFVKFFTRHAILALGAYVMMARFEFDPMAMLAGVTAPAVAAAVEIVRTVRARHRGLHSRSS